MTFTKERLEQFINNPLEHGLTRGEQMEMARQLLAGMEQKPVAWLWTKPSTGDEDVSLIAPEDDDDATDAVSSGWVHQPLYTAPPVPKTSDVESLATDLMKRIDKITGERHSIATLSSLRVSIVEVCRAAMLQGAEPVQEWIPCSERMPDFDTRVLLYFPDYGGHIEDGCIGDEGDGPYHYFFDGDSLRHEPTHWMPLPIAPQQQS